MQRFATASMYATAQWQRLWACRKAVYRNPKMKVRWSMAAQGLARLHKTPQHTQISRSRLPHFGETWKWIFRLRQGSVSHPSNDASGSSKRVEFRHTPPSPSPLQEIST